MHVIALRTLYPIVEHISDLDERIARFMDVRTDVYKRHRLERTLLSEGIPDRPGWYFWLDGDAGQLRYVGKTTTTERRGCGLRLRIREELMEERLFMMRHCTVDDIIRVRHATRPDTVDTPEKTRRSKQWIARSHDKVGSTHIAYALAPDTLHAGHGEREANAAIEFIERRLILLFPEANNRRRAPARRPDWFDAASADELVTTIHIRLRQLLTELHNSGSYAAAAE